MSKVGPRLGGWGREGGFAGIGRGRSGACSERRRPYARAGRTGEVTRRGCKAPCSASTAGPATSAGLAERSGAQRQRGDRQRLGPRRRAPRPGRESRQSVPPAERGRPLSQRSSVQSVARGHVGSTRGAAAGGRRPRVKKKVRPRSARSEEVAGSEARRRLSALRRGRPRRWRRARPCWKAASAAARSCRRPS